MTIMKMYYSCFYRVPLLFYFPVLWRSLILKNKGQLRNQLDVSSLAKITDGYTPGHMVSVCQQVLTERRVNQLSKKPLQAIEFVAPLARIDPVYKEEEEAFKVGERWFGKRMMIFGFGVCVCLCVCVHACVCACVCAYGVCVCACVCAYVWACVYAYRCVLVDVYFMVCPMLFACMLV